MIEPGMDIERCARRLSEGGSEAVKWEIRKLQWIREERTKQLQGEQDGSEREEPGNERR